MATSEIDLWKTLTFLVGDDPSTEAELRKVTWPALDRLRALLPTLRTSVLVALSSDSEALAKLMADELAALNKNERSVIGLAALVALGDEIDRRMPVPA